MSRNIQPLFAAVDQYLTYGNLTPPAEGLVDVGQKLDQKNVARIPMTYVTGACVRFDLATHPDTPDSDRPQIVDAAIGKLAPIKRHDPGGVDPRNAGDYVRGMTYLAFSDFYAMSVEGQSPSTGDVETLYGDLLQVGRQTAHYRKLASTRPRWSVAGTDIAGFQLELSAHILNARYNLDQGRVMQFSRPALPREDQPYSRDPNVDPQAPWDVGLSPEGFLDNQGVTRVQFKTRQEHVKPDPSVVNVTRADLGIRRNGAIIEDALTERDPGASTAEVKAATARLDDCTARLGDKLASA